MSKIKKIITVLSILVTIYSCSSKEEEIQPFPDYDTKPLQGSWRIIPSNEEKLLFENDKSYLWKDGKKIEIFALKDNNGVRFQYGKNDPTPFGYFLFTERNPKREIWTGIMNEKLIRIEKDIKRPESILE